MKKRNVSIIGTGALGTVLARALSNGGLPFASVYNRHKEAAEILSKEINALKAAIFPRAKSELGHLVFLTVPDRHIKEIAQKLAALDKNFDEYIFVHCSGSTGSDALRLLHQKGAAVASFHPIQTFTVASGPTDFQGIYIDMEGDKAAVKYLKEICGLLQCTAFEIKIDAKPYLHAAAVMASNYLVALLESAARIAQTGGIEKEAATRALMPLVKKSLNNISTSKTLSEALSGPVARGDSSTVAGHVELLKQSKELEDLYKKLGRVLVKMLNEGEHGGAQRLEEISMILEDHC